MRDKTLDLAKKTRLKASLGIISRSGVCTKTTQRPSFHLTHPLARSLAEAVPTTNIARPAYTRTLCASHAHSTHTVGKRRQHVRDYVRAHFVPSASPTIAEVGRVQSPSQPNMKQRLEALKRSGSPTNGGSGTASPKSTGGSGTATPNKNGNVPGNVSKSRTDNKSKNE